MIILFLLMTNIASADDWLCTSEASQRRDDQILACGIGRAVDENGARTQAFNNAKKEFNRLCMASDDCRGRKINVTPNRTACEQHDGSVVCRRLLSFEIGALDPASPKVSNSRGSSLADPVPVETFKPFSSAEWATYPRVKKCMSPEEIMRLWGKPLKVRFNEFSSHTMKSFTYRGAMCDGKGDKTCELTMTLNGQECGYNHEWGITQADGVKMEYDGFAIE